MKCKKCGNRMEVYETREKKDTVIRRRRCKVCGTTVRTIERKVTRKEMRDLHKKDELKSCRLCGGEAEILLVSNGFESAEFIQKHEVRCKNCKGGMQKEFTSRFTRDTSGEFIVLEDGIKEAIKEWNKRQG